MTLMVIKKGPKPAGSENTSEWETNNLAQNPAIIGNETSEKVEESGLST